VATVLANLPELSPGEHVVFRGSGAPSQSGLQSRLKSVNNLPAVPQVLKLFGSGLIKDWPQTADVSLPTLKKRLRYHEQHLTSIKISGNGQDRTSKSPLLGKTKTVKEIIVFLYVMVTAPTCC
jgi:hypothetical protein